MKNIGVFWKERGDVAKQNAEQDTKPQAQSGNFELQFNLWNVLACDKQNNASKRKKDFYALDIGLICPISTGEMALLLPFKIKGAHTGGSGKNEPEGAKFEDLNTILRGERELICTIFNDNLTCKEGEDNLYLLTKEGRDEFKLIMYSLGADNIIENTYDLSSNTTVLKFKIFTDFNTIYNNKYSNYRIFLRFRFLLDDLSAFSTKKNISNDFIQSAFSSSRLFDFRINDIRALQSRQDKKEEVLTNAGYKMPLFKKIHFFYMSDPEETITNGSKVKLDSRILESEQWNGYMGDYALVGENLAHHWKSPSGNGANNEPITSMSLFFKTEYTDWNAKRILLYLFVVALLSLLATAFANIISSLLSLNDNPLCSSSDWSVGIWSALTVIIAWMIWHQTMKRSRRS